MKNKTLVIISSILCVYLATIIHVAFLTANDNVSIYVHLAFAFVISACACGLVVLGCMLVKNFNDLDL